MIPPARRRAFAPAFAPGRARALPPLTVLAGSLATAWPWLAHAPLLPPFGLLLLLAWRLLAPASLRIWSPALLGFADDLVSGQPLGSAVMLWTAAFVVIELIDQRLVFRDFLQDWGIAAGIVAVCLVIGRYLASPWRLPLDGALGCQVAASVLLFPLAARTCARIDRSRSGPA